MRCTFLVLAALLLAPAVGATPAAAIVPLGQFGEGPGDQAGLLDVPRGVAVDASGRLYASEGERISVFSPRGAFLRAFGKDVVPSNQRTGFEQCTTVCQAGTRGGAAGELASAAELAVDAEGLLFVADALNHRISVFNQQGGFVRSFGKDVNASSAGTGFEVCTRVDRCKPGEPGSGSGELNTPLGVTISPNGILLVAEASNHRVSLYSREGVFRSAFGQSVSGLLGGDTNTCIARCRAGQPGSGPGALARPAAVAVDAAGTIYVSEFDNNRVSMFGPDVAFQRAFGANVIADNGAFGFEVCTTASGCRERRTDPCSRACDQPSVGCVARLGLPGRLRQGRDPRQCANRLRGVSRQLPNR